MSNREPGAREDRPSSRRGTVAALVAVAVLVGALFWALQAVVQHNAVQRCLDSGRRDCGGPATP